MDRKYDQDRGGKYQRPGFEQIQVAQFSWLERNAKGNTGKRGREGLNETLVE